MIIGVVGLIGSGKDTIAEYLVANHGFKQESFAASLKDAVALIFNWDRSLLEGTTTESREWRTQVDTWWAKRLGIPHLTPRWVLQYWGTDVCRHGFHDDIWIASLENKLQHSTQDIVISDVRFPNEISMVKRINGVTMQVTRGAEPYWFTTARYANKGDVDFQKQMKEFNIHNSEWAWVGSPIDVGILNNGTIADLHRRINYFLEIGS